MKPIQYLSTEKKELFLTFDDGPCVKTTPKVLDILDQLEVKATFYVVGEKALEHKVLVKDILARGHSIGDHSIDHAYYHFFCTQKHQKQWIERSQENLRDQFQLEPMGFRSPAGVRTPPLAKSLKELQIPWVHWQHRFFDTQFGFSESRFKKKIHKIKSGDIILLHDAQKEAFREPFLKGLKSFISELKDKGFDFQPITIKKFEYANR